MRNIGVIFGTILVVMFGIYIFVLAPRMKSSITNSNTSTISQSHTNSTPNQNNLYEAETDRYVIYKNGLIEASADTRRILFFYANWCSTCIPADKAIREGVSQIPQDVTIIRVNYNDTDTDEEEKDLARKYGITYQHTFVQIDSDGKVVTKWNGGALTELLENIK